MESFESKIISHNITRGISISKMILSALFIWAVFNVIIYNQVIERSQSPDQEKSVVFISSVVFLGLSVIMLLYRFKGYIKTVGKISLSEDYIKVSSRKLKAKLKFSEIDNFFLVYSHYKIPLLLLPGNNNKIKFTKNGEFFQFEFLVKSKKHHDLLLEIVKKWYENGVELTETDSRGYPQHLLKPVE